MAPRLLVCAAGNGERIQFIGGAHGDDDDDGGANNSVAEPSCLSVRVRMLPPSSSMLDFAPHVAPGQWSARRHSPVRDGCFDRFSRMHSPLPTEGSAAH